MAYASTAPVSTAATSARSRRVATTGMWRRLDVLLLAATAAIVVIGVVMIYSATRTPQALSGQSPTAYMHQQAVYAVIGAGAMVVTVSFDYRRYIAWAPLAYLGSILLLLATLAVGRSTLGATSWIQVGSFDVEPSEIVKVTLILSLAALLASRKGTVRGRVVLVVLALSVVPFALIYKQDALGSALVLAVVMVGMLLMAGTRGRHMVLLALVAVVGVGGVLQLGVLKQYQRARILVFATAPTGVGASTNGTNSSAQTVEYQLDQSKAAIADGGIEGKGLFKGLDTNLSFVPNQYTDFIFTAAAEQFGFVGSVVLLGLFLVVIWRSWRIANQSRDLAGALICVGVLSMITFQVFENVGMTMGIMPVAGITLPFMSYGGSSMIMDWVAIGLVLNVGMRRGA